MTSRPNRRGWTGSPLRLRVSPGQPPPLFLPPHHGEVTRPRAAVGVLDTCHKTPYLELSFLIASLRGALSCLAMVHDQLLKLHAACWRMGQHMGLWWTRCLTL